MVVEKMFNLKQKINKQLIKINDVIDMFGKNKYGSKINSMFEEKIIEQKKKLLLNFDFNCKNQWKNILR